MGATLSYSSRFRKENLRRIYQTLKEPEIKLAQATAEEKSKRNLKRTVSLAKENLKSARATRNKI
jgi:hypothetical protein